MQTKKYIRSKESIYDIFDKLFGHDYYIYFLKKIDKLQGKERIDKQLELWEYLNEIDLIKRKILNMIKNL